MRATHLARLSWGTAVVRTVERRRPQICATPARSGHCSEPLRAALLAWFALALPLVLAGYAGAMYLDAGSEETSPGCLRKPAGRCVRSRLVVRRNRGRKSFNYKLPGWYGLIGSVSGLLRWRGNLTFKLGYHPAIVVIAGLSPGAAETFAECQ
jgi:hypothetical protein